MSDADSGAGQSACDCPAHVVDRWLWAHRREWWSGLHEVIAAAGGAVAGVDSWFALAGIIAGVRRGGIGARVVATLETDENWRAVAARLAELLRDADAESLTMLCRAAADQLRWVMDGRSDH